MQFDEFSAKLENGKQFLEPTSVSATADNWASFLDAPNVGFVICDESLRYVKINDALARMNGIPPRLTWARPYTTFWVKLPPKWSRPSIRCSLPGNRCRILNWWRSCLPGQEPARWIENYFPIKDARGAGPPGGCRRG